ncbi:MAG: hypothetical protein ACRDGR_07475 [bacterium]
MRMLPPSLLRRSLMTAAVVALGAFGCEDQRGEPTGPDNGVLSGELTFFTGYVTLSIFNYHNIVAQQVLDIIVNDTPTPVFTPSCGTGGIRTIRPIPGSPMTFTVEHRQNDPFVLFPFPFSSDICDGFFRFTARKDMIVSFDPASFPDSLRFTITMPDDGSSQPGVVYQLPPEFDGVVLAVSGTVHGELVDIVYGGGGGIQSGDIRLTGAVRVEDRGQALLLVQELDLRYRWEPPLPFSPFPDGSYEIAGFTTSPFSGPIVGNPIEIQWDGFSKGTYVGSDGQPCTIDYLEFTSDCFSEF